MYVAFTCAILTTTLFVKPKMSEIKFAENLKNYYYMKNVL